MIARIQKSLKEKDQGFTLIELLVVMIIIGILAAIAIPVFLNQRKKAVDSSMKSDLRTVANAMETAYTDKQEYPTVKQGAAGGTVTLGVATDGLTVNVSANNTIAGTVDNTAAGFFCLEVTNPKGSNPWVYKSVEGGLQPSTVKDCS